MSNRSRTFAKKKVKRHYFIRHYFRIQNIKFSCFIMCFLLENCRPLFKVVSNKGVSSTGRFILLLDTSVGLEMNMSDTTLDISVA